MIDTVYKLSLNIGINRLTVPMGSEFLSVGNQREGPVVWFAGDLSRSVVVTRIIDVVMTGTPLSAPVDRRRFLGTIIMSQGDFILHAFESTDNPNGLPERMVDSDGFRLSRDEP